MSKIEKFLTDEDEQEIIEAIRIAEKKTSGEIRIHIERSTFMNAYDRAREVFHELKMDATQLKNGVLIYLAVDNHTFAICGDKGINDLVAPDFWDSTRDVMTAHFKERNFKQGLIDGILKAGDQLQKYFPCKDCDINELPNEISKG